MSNRSQRLREWLLSGILCFHTIALLLWCLPFLAPSSGWLTAVDGIYVHAFWLTPKWRMFSNPGFLNKRLSFYILFFDGKSTTWIPPGRDFYRKFFDGLLRNLPNQGLRESRLEDASRYVAHLFRAKRPTEVVVKQYEREIPDPSLELPNQWEVENLFTYKVDLSDLK